MKVSHVSFRPHNQATDCDRFPPHILINDHITRKTAHLAKDHMTLPPYVNKTKRRLELVQSWPRVTLLVVKFIYRVP